MKTSKEKQNRLARAWLIRNDPEYDWAAQSDDSDFIRAVRDNIGIFGPDESKTSRFFL